MIVTKVNIVQSVNGRLTSTVIDRKDLEKWMEERGAVLRGKKAAYSASGIKIRETLIGQPTFTRFHGPMHEEIRHIMRGEPFEGEAIRYEDSETERKLSL